MLPALKERVPLLVPDRRPLLQNRKPLLLIHHLHRASLQVLLWQDLEARP